MTAVEKLFVKTVERLLLFRCEPPVGEGRLRRDTRVIVSRMLSVFEKEYVVSQTQQPVADAALPRIGRVAEKAPYGLLRRGVGLH